MADSLVTLRARLGAYALHASRDSREITEAARANSPSSLAWHEHAVDPDGLLDPVERARRAEHHRRAYYTKLALASVRARRTRKTGAP